MFLSKTKMINYIFYDVILTKLTYIIKIYMFNLARNTFVNVFL